MKFTYEENDDKQVISFIGTETEIMLCIANFGFKLIKSISLPKGDFMKMFAWGLSYSDGTTAEDNATKAIALLKETAINLEKQMNKLYGNKPTLTNQETAALKVLMLEYQWLACDKNGVVYAYKHKPVKDDGLEIWYEKEDESLFLINKKIIQNLFQWCIWEDEPWYIPRLLENEKV